jgi:hypothetical protein
MEPTDCIFPTIEEKQDYTTLSVDVWTGTGWSLGALTYKTRCAELRIGQQIIVEMRKNIRKVRIAEFHKTRQDTNPEINYKFIEDVKVQDG